MRPIHEGVKNQGYGPPLQALPESGAREAGCFLATPQPPLSHWTPAAPGRKCDLGEAMHKGLMAEGCLLAAPPAAGK